jgi:CheY-like chemotaxis protein
VEDEFFIALDTENQTQELGHTVIGTAVTGDEAIAIAEREKPDAVLMDIRLIGEMDGITAAREIKSRFGIPSIFVTANTDPSTLRQAEAIEPVAVLQKPLTRDRLKAKLALLQKD